MAENRRDQQQGRSEQENSGRQEQQRGNNQQDQSVSNPQSGSQWDNYRTRELSAGDSRSSNNEGDDTVTVESGLGIDE